MKMIQLAAGFNPELTKDYIIDGRAIKIEVQYRGVEPEDDIEKAGSNVWAYQLTYRDVLVAAGPFRHTVEEEKTREEVANHLASFFGNGGDFDLDKLREEAMAETATSNMSTDDIIYHCWLWVQNEHAPVRERLGKSSVDSFDVVHSSFSDDGWVVIIDSGHDPSRAYRFTKKIADKKVTVATYVKAYQTHMSL